MDEMHENFQRITHWRLKCQGLSHGLYKNGRSTKEQFADYIMVAEVPRVIPSFTQRWLNCQGINTD